MKRLNLDNGNYMEIDGVGAIRFYDKNGEWHREDGPAVIRAGGYQEWRVNGRLHREDGKPAVVYVTGGKEWYLNGKLHREDGPAFVCMDGHQEWWLNGKKMSETEHARAVTKMKEDSNSSRSDHSGRTVIIDGKEYRLTLVDSE